MKRLIPLLLALVLMTPGFAQKKNTTNKAKAATTQVAKDKNTKKDKAKASDEKLNPVYDESIDPMEQLERALEDARATGRYVICQVGGNWCPWCLRLAAMIDQDAELTELVKENFVYIHVNVPREKEKRNYEVMQRLGNPGRFGYPALVIMGDDGRPMHIQNSSYLEEGEGYNKKKVMEFFQNWTRKAVETVK